MFNLNNCQKLLNELKCKHCSKVLSIFPIYYCGALGNICGRCTDNVKKMGFTLEQATAYEAVAKFLIFPCSNYKSGCEAKLTHSEVVQHEQLCNSMLAECPFTIQVGDPSINCDWKGTSKNIVQHLQNSHKNFLQVDMPSFVMDVHNPHIKMFFTTINDQTFIAIATLKPMNKFYSIVMCCDEAPGSLRYEYQLEVGRQDDFFLTLRRPVEAFCSIENFKNKMIAVDVALIKTMINDPNASVYYRISIMKKIKEEVSSITSAASSSRSVAEANTPKKQNNFVDELKCPTCNHYMVPPIFVCHNGHSVCNKCKTKVQFCPICKIPFGNSRNLTLEKVVRSFEYPCSFKGNGCDVSLTHEHIRTHEMQCSYSFFTCPFKSLALCNHNDKIFDLIQHLKKKHGSYMVEANMVYSVDINNMSDTLTYCVTTFKNEVFAILIKSNTDPSEEIVVNCLHVAMNKNKPKYKFEIHFSDQTGNGLKLVVSQLCNEFPSNIDSAFINSLTVPTDLLEPFVTEKEDSKLVHFKCYVLRL